MVQNLPANESAMRAPISGVKLPVPPKLLRVLEAGTKPMFSWSVRYVIKLACEPVDANLSHTSLTEVSKTVLLVL